MNIFKTNIIYIIVLGFLFSSCEDYLTKVNPNGSNSAEYWTTLDEVQGTLNGAYANLKDTKGFMYRENALRADLSFPGKRSNPTFSYQFWYWHNYNATTTAINNSWAVMYRGVYRANQVIYGLEKLKNAEGIDMERWALQMAEARCLRGIFHFYVHAVFNNGEVVIQDKYEIDVQNVYKSLSSSADVVDFFRADLSYAYDNLPYENNKSGKVTKGVAAAILGTSYLYQKEYDQALVMFNDIIDNPDYPYELIEDISLLYTNEGEYNAENILEVGYTIDFNTQYGNWDENVLTNTLARVSSPTGQGQFVPSSWLIYAYQHEAIDPTDVRNTVTVSDGSDRLRMVSYRASAMMALPNDFDTPYYKRPYALYSGQNNELSNFFGSLLIGFFKHYTNHSILDNENNTPAGSALKSGKNIVLHRLSEVYLMAAECHLKMGNSIEGLDLINTVRARWALQLLGPDADGNGKFDGYDYAANPDSLWQRYMHVEKPLECSIEGYAMRSIDLRRWEEGENRFDELSKQTWYFVDFDYIDPASGASKTLKNGMMLTEEPVDFDGEKVVEYEMAAQNYQNDVHAYLDIPSDERLNNPYIGAGSTAKKE